MATSKVRTAVIGAGVGWIHMEGYQHSPLSELVAICDLNEQLLEERGAKYGIPPARRYTNYHELLAQPDIDAVSVCVPNFLHESITLEALKQGKHVLCEKPLALNATAAQGMVDAAKAAGRLLLVCYNHRYRSEIVWLKSLVRRGDFGPIYAAKAGWMREAGIPGGDRGWFTDKARSGGGALIDLGVHVLDLALWLMDYPAPVAVTGASFSEFGPRQQKSAQRDAKPARFDVDDLGLGMVRFANGAALMFESAWATHREPGQDAYFVRLFGKEAGANFYTGLPNGQTVSAFKYVDGEPVAITPRLGSYAHGHFNVVHHFADCIANGVTPESPGEHGVTCLKIIDAIYESARTGREAIV